MGKHARFGRNILYRHGRSNTSSQKPKKVQNNIDKIPAVCSKTSLSACNFTYNKPNMLNNINIVAGTMPKDSGISISPKGVPFLFISLPFKPAFSVKICIIGINFFTNLKVNMEVIKYRKK
jgi:hypothetical protein